MRKQYGVPMEVEFTRQCPRDAVVEAEVTVHRLCAVQRRDGEWFDVDRETGLEAVEMTIRALFDRSRHLAAAALCLRLELDWSVEETAPRVGLIPSAIGGYEIPNFLFGATEIYLRKLEKAGERWRRENRSS